MLYCAVLYFASFCCVVLCCVVLCCVVLCCDRSCCAVLCCTVLPCVVMCCTRILSLSNNCFFIDLLPGESIKTIPVSTLFWLRGGEFAP